MAFTSEGMFYLGKEDLAPTIDSAGTGIRSMFGLQNKKEAVDSILESGNFDTPESRRAVLEQIRAVDSEAYYKYADLNQKYESKELDLKSKFGSPALKRAWKDTEAPAYTTKWATQNLSFYDLEGAIKALGRQPTTEADITNMLMWLAKNDDDLEPGKAGMLKASYLSMFKNAKTNYMDLNEFNPPGSFKSNQTRDINSIQGRSSYTTTPIPTDTDTDTPIIPKQQYKIEMRNGKPFKVPYTPPVPYDVQQKLNQQEQEVLSNMPGMY